MRRLYGDRDCPREAPVRWASGRARRAWPITLPEELRRGSSKSDISTLDASQTVAACAIAGTDGLVTVTGPAGAGKTTMLRVAFQSLTRQRRRMLVVAPTRKAASVAAQEIGTSASSIHALLADYGYRWRTDDAGAKVWTRLRRGDADRTREASTEAQRVGSYAPTTGSSWTKPAWSISTPLMH